MKAAFPFLCFVLLLLLSACADRGLGSDLMDKKHCFRKYTKRAVNKDADIKGSCPLTVVTKYPEKYKYKYPVFNPSDKNEVAYVRSTYDEGSGKMGQPELWTFNFCTGKTKRMASVILNAPDWSAKDWLIYRGSGSKLFKVKSNGDSLTTLPKIKGTNLTPGWNDKGDLFAIRVKKKDQKPKILVATENGLRVGVFDDFILKSWDWVGKQITYVDAGEGKQEIKMFNFVSRTSHVIETIKNYSTSDSLFLNTIYFKEKELVFWNQFKQISYTDIKNKKRKVIKKGAGNRQYHQISLSADGKTIIANRVDIKKISSCQKEERWSLVLIDVETGVERKVKLPK